MGQRNKIWHTVFIKFRDGVSGDQKRDIFERYQRIAQKPGREAAGVIFFHADWSIDTRGGVDLIEIAVFEDERAREAFKSGPELVELVEMLRSIADWRIGDMDLPAIIV